MLKVTCSQAQTYLRSGGLPAGFRGRDNQQASILEHVASCPACQALSQNLEQVEGMLRRTLHAHWDPIPLPAQPNPYAILSYGRSYTMAHTLLKLSGAFVVLVLMTVAVLSIRDRLPGLLPQKPVQADLHSMLLQPEDLPTGTSYYIPGDEVNPGQGELTNEKAVSSLGKDYEKRIRDTGRVTGQFIYYQRRDPDDPGPDLVYNLVQSFQTSTGARNWLETDVDMVIKSGDWQELPDPDKLGDAARALKQVSEGYGGQNRVTYRVEFAYHNLVVRVNGVDLERKISVETVEKLARTVLEKIQKADGAAGP